jgi:hypothetical protein
VALELRKKKALWMMKFKFLGPMAVILGMTPSVGSAQSQMYQSSDLERLELSYDVLARAQGLYENKLGSMLSDGLSPDERSLLQQQIELSMFCIVQKDYFSNIALGAKDTQKFTDQRDLLKIDYSVFAGALQTFDLADQSYMEEQYVEGFDTYRDRLRSIYRRYDADDALAVQEIGELTQNCKGKLANIEELHKLAR